MKSQSGTRAKQPFVHRAFRSSRGALVIGTTILTLVACGGSDASSTPGAGPNAGASAGSTLADGGTGSTGGSTGEKPCSRAPHQAGTGTDQDVLCQNLGGQFPYAYACEDNERPESALACAGAVINGLKCCKVDRENGSATPAQGAGSPDAGAESDGSAGPLDAGPPAFQLHSLDDLTGTWTGACDLTDSVGHDYAGSGTVVVTKGSNGKYGVVIRCRGGEAFADGLSADPSGTVTFDCGTGSLTTGQLSLSADPHCVSGTMQITATRGPAISVNAPTASGGITFASASK